jgi:hypothetical protein
LATLYRLREWTTTRSLTHHLIFQVQDLLLIPIPILFKSSTHATDTPKESTHHQKSVALLTLQLRKRRFSQQGFDRNTHTHTQNWREYGEELKGH